MNVKTQGNVQHYNINDTRVRRLVLHWPGQPIAKGRARSFIHNETKKMTHATPKKTQVAQDSLRAFAALMMGAEKPFTRPIRLRLHFRLKVPSSWSSKRCGEAVNATASEGFAMTKRPDLDNLEKLVKDALNGVVYIDDAQVVVTHKGKWYGEEPYTSIIVEELACDPAPK